MRIGHNREAAFEFFILKMEPDLELVITKRHNRIDKAIFFSYDFKNRQVIEFDRVFRRQSELLPEVVYVFEFGGLISRSKIDRFLAKLAVSRHFGSNVSGEWRKKSNVLGLMGGFTFNPKETVAVGQDRLTLAQYAFRQGIRLIPIGDLNAMLRKRGVLKTVTVQKITKACINEDHVRAVLNEIWSNPSQAEAILAKAWDKLEEHRDMVLKTAQKWHGIGTDSNIMT